MATKAFKDLLTYAYPDGWPEASAECFSKRGRE